VIWLLVVMPTFLLGFLAGYAVCERDTTKDGGQ
jgi:hypothetical protein